MCRWCFFALSAFLLAGCTSSSLTDAANPASPSTRCSLTLAADAVAFSATGGAGKLAVDVNRECGWTAKADVDWIALTSSTNGQGQSQVTYSVAANTALSERRGGIIVNDQRVEIAESAAAPPPPPPPALSPCSVTLSSLSQSIGASGGAGSVGVSAAANCPWTATSDATWLVVAAGGSGTGNGTIQFTVAANTSIAQRSGRLSVGGPTFTVTEAGTSTSPCTLAVTPLAVSVASAVSTSTVAVTASSGCAWTATSNVSWISLRSAASGTGNAVVQFSILANATTSARSGTLTIAGQTVTVTQAGTAPPPCTFALSPTTQSVSAAGGPGLINVTPSASTCAWTASTTTSWITITSGTSGTGNGQIAYSAAANTSTSSRTGTIAAAGQTVTVTQAGAPPPCTFTLSATTQTVKAGGGTGQFDVTASGSSCAWTASTVTSWITITSGGSGTGNGQVKYSGAANPSTSPRTGTITAAGQTVTITQPGR